MTLTCLEALTALKEVRVNLDALMETRLSDVSDEQSGDIDTLRDYLDYMANEGIFDLDDMIAGERYMNKPND